MFGPETMWKRADEVKVGDRIAERNICGGFVGWMRVTETLDGRVITFAVGGDFPSEYGGVYAVTADGEMVEVAAAQKRHRPRSIWRGTASIEAGG